MISNILNSVSLTGFIISAVYGIITVTKDREISLMFKMSLLAVTALLISRLYFIILDLSGGNINEFSVGVLGQVAGYLFLVLANSTYLPLKNDNKSFDYKAIPVIIFPIICYAYSAIVIGTTGEIICSALYLCSTCPSLFYSFKNILVAKTDSSYKSLKPFFACTLILTSVSVLESAVYVIRNALAFNVAIVLLTVGAFSSTVFMLPALKRGLKNNDN